MASETALQRLQRLCPTISVGLLTADLMRLGDEIGLLSGSGVEILHFDVMDGCFCPMMTVGPPFIKGVRAEGYLKDVHLMVSDPIDKVLDYVSAGADIVTFHVEAAPTHLHRVLQLLSSEKNRNDPERGLVRGIALNPGTPVCSIEPILGAVQMVTLLGINPGWSGQSLVPETAARVVQVRELARKRGSDVLIALDGGVTRSNIGEVAGWGVDLVVTGSAVFDGVAPASNALFMLQSLREGSPR